MSDSQDTYINAISTVMVPVTDQDAALEFYVGKLGFELRSDVAYGEGERWVEVAPAGAATVIALVPQREGEAGGTETRITFGTEDVDAAHAAMQAQGIDVDAEVLRMEEPVPPMFFFRDQDANSLLLVREP